MDKNFEELKDIYHDGYRCIHKESGDDLTLQLKNFEREKIVTIKSSDKMEIGKMENFLDTVEVETKLHGYDSICTQHEKEDL
ncbi:MAG: hypothetical protein ATN36_05770 [Epulopiscium sp. Nele67-Bin005]|nr:MAG: hypothetical protein ATN36_05770 [Epulopiscium sp. Nele67-Bin005]